MSTCRAQFVCSQVLMLAAGSGKPPWLASILLSSAGGGPKSSVPPRRSLHGAMPLYATRCILTGKTRWRSSRSTSSPSTRPTLAARPAVRLSGPSTRSPGTQPAKRPLSVSTLLDEPVPLGRPRRMPRQEIARRRLQHAGASTLDELFLHRRRVKPRTRAIYFQAATELERFAYDKGFNLLDQQSRDKAATRYLSHLFFKGEGAYAGRAALYGLAFKLTLNLRDPCELPLSRASLRGYGQAAPERQRDPLPWEACCLIAAWLARRDHPGDLDAARAFVVTFDGYLRPSETLALRGIDITVLRHRTSLPYRKVSVTLAPFRPDDGDPAAPTTKAGDYDDTVLFGDPASCAAQRGFIADMLARCKSSGSALGRIFNIRLFDMELKFKQAVTALGLTRLHCTPHCLRHGGPSTDFALSFRTLEDIQRRGRWHAQASVKRYEKAGRLTKQVAMLTPGHLQQAKRDIVALPVLL